MKRFESLKRMLVLQMSLIGLVFQTLVYAYQWFNEYYPRVHAGRGGRPGLTFYSNGHILMILIYFVLLVFFSKTYGSMKIGYLKPTEVFFSQIFSLLAVNVISYFQISLMANWVVKIRPMIYTTIIQLIISAVWTMVSNTFYKRVFPPRNMLLVYGERSIDDILVKFSARRDKYNITKCMNVSDGIETIQNEILNDYGAMIIWDIHTEDRNKLLKYCYAKSIRIYTMPKIPDVLIKGSTQQHLFDTPILLTREYALTVEQRMAKRAVDIIFALLIAVVTSPIMLITAILIKCYDKGPVIYKQVRCTKDNKEFSIMKFRSMRVDAEKDGVARLATTNDSRITPIGKFIRTVRIDELPQLFNIIKGEMSFIGPRPERPEIIAEYIEDMPEFAFRTRVKAGLAGYAQVYGKYNTTPYDKLKLDLTYIENYSVWLDFKLMLLTLKILFKPESTEGVEEKQVTAMKESGKKNPNE